MIEPIGWNEPDTPPLQKQRRQLFAFGAFCVSAVLVILTVVWREFQFGLGAAVFLITGVFLLSPKRLAASSRTITLSEEELSIGNRSTPTADLAGFWVSADEGNTIVTFEHKKPLFIPLTTIFPGSPDEAANAVAEFLQELEPRETSPLDRFSNFFRF